MTNEQALKALTGTELMDTIKMLGTFPYLEYLDIDKWLSSNCPDPTFKQIQFHFRGNPGRWRGPEGNMTSCLILDLRTRFGERVAVIMLQNGQFMTVPLEQVDLMQVER